MNGVDSKSCRSFEIGFCDQLWTVNISDSSLNDLCENPALKELNYPSISFILISLLNTIQSLNLQIYPPVWSMGDAE